MSMLFIQKQLKGDCMTFAAEQVCFEVQPAISFLPVAYTRLSWNGEHTRRGRGRNNFADLLKTHKMLFNIQHRNVRVIYN